MAVHIHLSEVSGIHIRNTAPYAGQMCDVQASFLVDWELRCQEAGACALPGPVGVHGRARKNTQHCSVAERATALDGSRPHRLRTGPAVMVGFDASLILPCQAVLSRVKSSPQVLDLRVIELARTMSRGPRARSGQNHVSNHCVGSCDGWCCACIPPTASPST